MDSRMLLLVVHEVDVLRANSNLPALLYLVLQRPMAQEALLPSSALMEAHRLASCILAYLSAHHELVEPVLDLFLCLAVS